MSRQRSTRATRWNFLIAFLFAFAIFCLFFLLLFATNRPSTLPTANTEPIQADAATYVPSRAETLNVLFVGVQPDGSEANVFLLARFDPVQGSVPVICFPPSTAVQNDNRTQTLAEVYRYGGASYTRTILQTTLGLTIHRFVRMDEFAFTAAASTLGAVQFDLEQPVQLIQDGVEMTLQPGTQLLDGPKILAILRAQNDSLQRCALTANLAAAIVNQHISICQSDTLDSVFRKIINLVESDITYDDYDTRKQAAAFLAQMRQNPAVALTVDGKQEDDAYHLADTFIAQLTQSFS